MLVGFPVLPGLQPAAGNVFEAPSICPPLIVLQAELLSQVESFIMPSFQQECFLGQLPCKQ